MNIRYTPDDQFDWSDDKPQRSMDSLTVADFMLSKSDAEEMSTRATRYMMGSLVANFSTFSDLKEFVPDETPLHPVVKTEVIPMKILFRDEKYISENDRDTKLLENAKLCGDPQVNTILKTTSVVIIF